VEDPGHHCTYGISHIHLPHHGPIGATEKNNWYSHFGGRFGYSGPKSNLILKNPPSYGVPPVEVSRIAHSPGRPAHDLKQVICLTWPLDPSLHSCEIFFIDYYPHAFGRIVSKSDGLFR
jgi:hypothetical protein